MKRRGIVSAALLLLLVVLLSGCGKDQNPLDKHNPVSITIWHYYNGRQKQLFDEMVNRFNETVGMEEGIVVEAVSQGVVSDLESKVMAAVNEDIGADEVPDIFAAYADMAYQVNEKGLLVDIRKYMSEEELAEFIPYYMSEGEFDGDGSIKLFPIAKSTELLFVNMTDWNLFAEATGSTEEGFKTWEGITKLSEEYYRWTDSLTPEPEDGKAFFGRDAMANYLLIGSMQLGTEIFQVKDGEMELHLEPAVFRKLWDNYYIPYINGYMNAFGKFRSDDVKTGDLIAYVGSTSSATYFPAEITREDGTSYPVEAGVYPIPNFEGNSSYAVQQGASMVVTKGSEAEIYASIEFLKWFTAKEQNVDFSVSSGYLPVKTADNSEQVIQSAVDNSKEKIPDILVNTLKIAVGMTQNSVLYTSKAFENGTSARAVLEKKLSAKAAKDRNEVLQKIEKGLSKEEAVALYDTDLNFNTWLHDLEYELNELR